jgi:hypothetical protein
MAMKSVTPIHWNTFIGFYQMTVDHNTFTHFLSVTQVADKNLFEVESIRLNNKTGEEEIYTILVIDSKIWLYQTSGVRIEFSFRRYFLFQKSNYITNEHLEIT